MDSDGERTVAGMAWLYGRDGRPDGTPIGHRSLQPAGGRRIDPEPRHEASRADRRQDGMGVGWPEEDRSADRRSMDSYRGLASPPGISLELDSLKATALVRMVFNKRKASGFVSMIICSFFAAHSMSRALASCNCG